MTHESKRLKYEPASEPLVAYCRWVSVSGSWTFVSLNSRLECNKGRRVFLAPTWSAITGCVVLVGSVRSLELATFRGWGGHFLGREARLATSINDKRVCTPPWRQPSGKWMVSLHSRTNTTSRRKHLWEIDLRFALNSTPGWCGLSVGLIDLLQYHQNHPKTSLHVWTGVLVGTLWRAGVPRS